jgi:hypothetical protein
VLVPNNLGAVAIELARPQHRPRKQYIPVPQLRRHVDISFTPGGDHAIGTKLNSVGTPSDKNRVLQRITEVLTLPTGSFLGQTCDTLACASSGLPLGLERPSGIRWQSFHWTIYGHKRAQQGTAVYTMGAATTMLTSLYTKYNQAYTSCVLLTRF